MVFQRSGRKGLRAAECACVLQAVGDAEGRRRREHLVVHAQRAEKECVGLAEVSM